MTTKHATHDGYADILTTELNGLVDAGNAITSSPLSNDGASERDLFANFSLSIATQPGNRDTPAFVHLYILPEVNGVYAFGDASVDPSLNHYRGSFQFDGGALAARVDVLTEIKLPNSDYHVLLMNDTGEDFAATGNVLSQEIQPGYVDA